MGWFKNRTPVPRINTDLGVFVFDDNYNGSWITEPRGDEAVAITVTRPDFEFKFVDCARRLVADIERYRAAAIEYIQNSEWRLEDPERFKLDSIDVTHCDTGDNFGVTFYDRDNSDFTVTVEFTSGVPSEVWAAD